MWIVFKIDRKKIKFFRNEIKFKAGSKTLIYSLKMLINYFLKNKLVSKELLLLGDYIFCYNKNFSNKFILETLGTLKAADIS